MNRVSKLPIPVIRCLKKLGGDISDARKRRKITMELMAKRSGISRSTIGRIEKGDPFASIGAYASVLFILGMEDKLADLVDIVNDPVGRRLEEENLPKRVRLPGKRKKKDD